jgi:hypothetical protein
MKIRTMVAMMAILGMGAQAEQADERVTVYLMNDTIVPLTILGPARSMATILFTRAGVQIRWRSGRPADAPSSGDRTVVVRLEDRTPLDLEPDELGFAAAQEGIHSTVFYNRIERMALGDGSRTLLAYVLVHEITHLLQGENRHSESGIMKAHWGPNDYSQIAQNPFTYEDVELIHHGMLTRRARQSPGGSSANPKAIHMSQMSLTRSA